MLMWKGFEFMQKSNFQSVQVLVAPLPTQLRADVPGKAVEDDPTSWVSVSHVKDPEGIACSWLQLVLVLAVAAILGSKSADVRPSFVSPLSIVLSNR